MGKLVMLAVVKGQYIGRLIPSVDGFINLDRRFFEKCALRDKIVKQREKHK
jgi:hypothetical protein